MTPRRPPRLLGATALAIAAIGVVFLAGHHAWGTEWNALGAGLIILAGCLWLGVGPARWVAVGAGILALLPGGYGLMASFVIAEQVMLCAGRQVASAAMSYPAGFCQTINWYTHVGLDVALIGLGVLGLITVVAALRNPAHFARPVSAATAAHSAQHPG